MIPALFRIRPDTPTKIVAKGMSRRADTSHVQLLAMK